MRILSLIFCFFLATNTITLDSSNSNLDSLGLRLQALVSKDKDDLLDFLDFSVNSNQHSNERISCMAIDALEPNNIYLGFEDNSIDVYSSDEVYKHTISFTNYGSYQIFTYNGELYLYLIRGSWLVSFNDDGQPLEAYELDPQSSNSNEAILDIICNQIELKVGDLTYQLGSNSSFVSFWGSSFSYLKITDKDGNGHYMYKTTDNEVWASWVLAIAFLIVVPIIISSSVAQSKPSRKPNNRIS